MYQAHSNAIQHSVLKAGNGPGDKEDTATAVALLLLLLIHVHTIIVRVKCYPLTHLYMHN